MPVTSLPSSFLILQPPFNFSYQLSSSSSLAFNSILRPLYSPSNSRYHSAFSKINSPRDNAIRGGRSGALSCALPISTNTGNWVSEFHSKSFNSVLSVALTVGLFFGGIGLAEAKVGVNKPQLLPKEYSNVIDVAGFLSDGQEKRLSEEIAALEKDTGFKLRVLAQNYPETPGLAIKDFWQVDDRTIVFVADPTFGNILNFNVGASVDLDIPRSFWSRLAGKYGNIFYWKEKGEDASIEAAVVAISNCLREPVGPNNCSDVK